MRLRHIFLGFIILATSSLAWSGCTRGSGLRGVVRPVDSKEVAGLLRNDFAILVDVREEDEILGGMAEKAIWFPTSKIRDDNPEWKVFVSHLPQAKEIVFYCAGGVRAEKAAQRLAAQGFRTANMGGFGDWTAAGLPVRKPQSH